MKDLFSLNEKINYHPAYKNIVEKKSLLAIKAKEHYQNLYEQFIQLNCEETNFSDGIKKQWHSRIWEMYFTCKLNDLDYKVSCPKGNAPDIKLKIGDQVIWIECTTLSKGDKAITEHEDEELHTLYDEDYILRITSAIDSKYKQINAHIESGVIKENDIVLIAINTGELMLTDIAQHDYPLIQKALYGIGSMTYSFTTKKIKNLNRPLIANSNDAKIKTNLFTTEDYKYISGVIFSTWKSTEIEQNLSDNFELTHNLFAKNKLEEGFFNFGIEYIPFEDKGRSEFRKMTHSSNGVRK